MATDGNRATTAWALKVPRLPGGIMIYPMIVGLLINTFCPKVLEIGGFFTAATRGGANAVVAAILLFVGAGISFKATPGAVGILFLTAGPTVAMIILGVSGLASIPLGTVIGSVLPLVIGMVLGNCFPFVRDLLKPGANPAIAVLGFQLGCSMSLASFVTGVLSGILLGLVTVFVVGPVTCLFERLCGGTGKAAIACSTIAGTAMTTPAALVEVAPQYAAIAPVAYAQIATAVIVTALLAPILTGWFDKRFCRG